MNPKWLTVWTIDGVETILPPFVVHTTFWESFGIHLNAESFQKDGHVT